jgi:uncharacterized iron-regulated protein/outer membrane lipoprotein-sorting protein
MNRVIVAAIVLIGLCVFANGQIAYSAEQMRVFDGNGNPASIDQIVKAMEKSDVVFLGEQHDDEVGHAVELEIIKQAVAQYSAKRKVTVSLEMFERDVQVVLDEYLKGLISEQHFLLSSRPWKNYQTDYRPIVEFAREKKLYVIAANAPRRYVNMVSRNGRDSLNGLSKDAKKWLAPLPYGEPSETYAKKFKALMGPSPEAQMGIDKILASQSLWDATMSNSVANYLKNHKGSLVIQLNGGFHTESRLGTVEHLMRYRPKTRILVVTIHYVDDFKTFDKAKDTDTGDFVILTKPKAVAGGVISAILRRMDDQNKSLQSLKCDLTMAKYDSALKFTDMTYGNASYLPKTPHRGIYLRLDWTKPVEEQIVMIGEEFELYRPRLNQVIIGKMKSAANNSEVGGALSFMSMSKDQLRANYTIMYIGEEKITDGTDTWHLVVTPKIATSYKNAEIWVDSDGMPRQVKVNEQNGDATTVLLSNTQKNVMLKGEIFKLSYPSTVKRIKL